MKKLLLLISITLFTLTFASCEKEDDGRGDGVNTFSVRFINQSSNPYNLYIDGGYKTKLSGNTYEDYSLDKGSHTWNVEQVSGYVLYPTVKNGDFDLTSDITITFP